MGIGVEEIWKLYHTGLKRFILNRINNVDDAEDILQDVFCKIHTNIGFIKDTKTIKIWVYRIARNTVIDYYRHRKVDIKCSSIPENLALAVDTTSKPPEITSVCLKSIINNLPDKYRQAIVLCEYDGMTQKELAGTLGISITGAKSRVQRARKMLQAILKKSCEFQFDRRGNVIDYQPKVDCARYCSNETINMIQNTCA
jgi:RNA polymerase sigma-70 factor (ECF subfamily)